LCLSTGCDVVIGADFDVQGRTPDRDAAPQDARFDLGRTDDSAEADAARDRTDGGIIDAFAPHDALDAPVAPDAAADSAAPDTPHDGGADASGGGGWSDVSDDAIDSGSVDAIDGGPVDAIDDGPIRPDGGLRPTIVMSGFVPLGPSNRPAGALELRGQIMSPAIVRGSASGIALEGRFQ
jgi:hypothetical protein